jgi:hypothetical protein
MSSGKLKDFALLKDLKENGPYLNFIVSELVTPFPNNHKSDYIYDGSENIPFKEREPLYQSILLEEFVSF